MSNNGAKYMDIKDVTLRSELRPGDIGWIVGKHGLLYHQLFESVEEVDVSDILRYEINTAKMFGDYFHSYNSDVEMFWFAEIDGVSVGFINMRRLSDSVVKLDRLLVDTIARGRGIGSRLVDVAIDFARDKGYQKVVLRTHAHQTIAAKIYSKKGFKFSHEESVTKPNGEIFTLKNLELNL